MQTDLLALKAHVDDIGNVWYSSASRPPVNTGKNVMSFLMSPICKEIPRYRLMATHNNVQLILPLFMRCLQAGKGLVEICSPLACGTAAERKNPEHVLYAIRQYQQVASLGGWHTFSKFEYPAYALHSYLEKNEGKVDEHAIKLLESHPVWPALSFIPNLDKDAVCHLLAEILDPRWFLNPKNPSRGSRLRKYLGLDMPTVTWIQDNTPTLPQHKRCELVEKAIYHGPVASKHPSYFLNRVFDDHNRKGYDHGVLRMMQTFIEYLRLTWLAALGASKFQLEALFVPEHFFNDEFEVAAWRQHMKKKLGEING